MAVRSMLDAAAGASLAKRFTWITAARLLLLTILLVLIVFINVRSGFTLATFTTQTALATLAIAYALTAIYAAFLRSGRSLHQIVNVQLVTDQLVWTVAVYLSGAASSGATSFYGLSCVTGAVLAGFRGAAIACITGALCFVGLLMAMSGGILTAPPDQPLDVYLVTSDEMMMSGALNVLVLAVVTLLAGNLAERLRWTGGLLEEAQERAVQAERMAALGRLAAGLAHEIRNPLGSITGSIQLLKANRALSNEDQQLCAIVEREASRLNDLVTDMMDLSRPRQPNIVETDATKVVTDVVKLASQSGRGVSDVRVSLEALDAARVMADGAQLRQLVWNLVRNAVEASSAGDEVRVRLGLNSDSHVQLSVEDDGVGLQPEAVDRIFDAFFTTRSHGTGVGLAVVKRIADDHGFLLSVESEPGGGACFRVDLGRRLDPETAPAIPNELEQDV